MWQNSHEFGMQFFGLPCIYTHWQKNVKQPYCPANYNNKYLQYTPKAKRLKPNSQKVKSNVIILL